MLLLSATRRLPAKRWPRPVRTARCLKVGHHPFSGASVARPATTTSPKCNPATSLGFVSSTQVHFDADAVNRELYDFESPELIAKCREELQRNEICILTQFLTARAASQMMAFAEHEQLLLGARARDSSARLTHSNIYYQEPDLMRQPNPNHPLNTLVTRSNTYITSNKIPNTMGLRRLQDDPTFISFLEKVTGRQLRAYNCKVSKFVFSISGHGDHQDWHFDNNFLTLTFMLQKPCKGGLLEVYPRIGRENYSEIAKVLGLERLKSTMMENPIAGPSSSSQHSSTHGKAEQQAKTLEGLVSSLQIGSRFLSYEYEVRDCVLFFGRESLHRSTTVEGDRDRVIAIISYNTEDLNARHMPNLTHMEKVYNLGEIDLELIPESKRA